MITSGIPATAICDGCGASAEAIEQRNPKTQALTAAFLPERWKMIIEAGDNVHLCGDCVARHPDPFGFLRPHFNARLENLGPGLVADIAESLGLPRPLARLWAAEWQQEQERLEARINRRTA